MARVVQLWEAVVIFSPWISPSPNSLSCRLSFTVLAFCSKFWPLTVSWNFASLSKFDYSWISLLLIMILSTEEVHFLNCKTYRILKLWLSVVFIFESFLSLPFPNVQQQTFDICKLSCYINAFVTCSTNYTFAVKAFHSNKASPWGPSSFTQKKVWPWS